MSSPAAAGAPSEDGASSNKDVRMVTRSMTRRTKHVDEVVSNAKRRAQAYSHSSRGGELKRHKHDSIHPPKRPISKDSVKLLSTPTGMRLHSLVDDDPACRNALDLIPSNLADILLPAPFDKNALGSAISTTVHEWEKALLSGGDGDSSMGGSFDPWAICLPPTGSPSNVHRKPLDDGAPHASPVHSFSDAFDALVRAHYHAPPHGGCASTLLDVVIATFITMHPELMEHLLSPFVRLLGDRSAPQPSSVVAKKKKKRKKQKQPHSGPFVFDPTAAPFDTLIAVVFVEQRCTDEASSSTRPTPSGMLPDDAEHPPIHQREFVEVLAAHQVRCASLGDEECAQQLSRWITCCLHASSSPSLLRVFFHERMKRCVPQHARNTNRADIIDGSAPPPPPPPQESSMAMSGTVEAMCLQKLVDGAGDLSSSMCTALVHSLLMHVARDSSRLRGHIAEFCRPFHHSIKMYFTEKPCIRSDALMREIILAKQPGGTDTPSLASPSSSSSNAHHQHTYQELLSVVLRVVFHREDVVGVEAAQSTADFSSSLTSGTHWSISHLLRPVFQVIASSSAKTYGGDSSMASSLGSDVGAEMARRVLRGMFSDAHWQDVLFGCHLAGGEGVAMHVQTKAHLVHVMALIGQCDASLQRELLGLLKSLWIPRGARDGNDGDVPMMTVEADGVPTMMMNRDGGDVPTMVDGDGGDVSMMMDDGLGDGRIQPISWTMVFALLHCYPVLPGDAYRFFACDVLRTRLGRAFHVLKESNHRGKHVDKAIDDPHVWNLSRLLFRWASPLARPFELFVRSLANTSTNAQSDDDVSCGRGDFAEHVFLSGLEAIDPAGVWSSPLIHSLRGDGEDVDVASSSSSTIDGMEDGSISTALGGHLASLDALRFMLDRSDGSDSDTLSGFVRRCIDTPRGKRVLHRHLGTEDAGVSIAVLSVLSKCAIGCHPSTGEGHWDTALFSAVLMHVDSPSRLVRRAAVSLAVGMIDGVKEVAHDAMERESILWAHIEALPYSSIGCVSVLVQLCGTNPKRWVSTMMNALERQLECAEWNGGSLDSNAALDVSMKVVHGIYARFCNGDARYEVPESVIRRCFDVLQRCNHESGRVMELAMLSMTLHDPRPPVRSMARSRIHAVVRGCSSSSAHFAAWGDLVRRFVRDVDVVEEDVVVEALNMRLRLEASEARDAVELLGVIESLCV